MRTGAIAEGHKATVKGITKGMAKLALSRMPQKSLSVTAIVLVGTSELPLDPLLKRHQS